MSFHFSLQRILDLRLLEVNEAQKNVNNTKSTIFKLKKLLEQERELYFSDREELNAVVKEVEFTGIQIYEKSLAIRQSKMMELLKNIRETQKELRFQEDILVQARLNQKIIEKLYGIKRKEYEKKEQIKEQYLLDEMATMGFRKNHPSNDEEGPGGSDE